MFSWFWIILTIIILNSISGRLPISSSFVWFGGHLSCSFTCWIFLCLFILFRLLCLECLFCRLEVCGFSLLWSLLPVDGLGLVACQGFLVRGACICVLAGEAGSLSLKCNEVSSIEFWGVYGFGMALGSLSFNVYSGLCCWRISMLCLALELVGSCSGTCWLLGGAWFQWRYGGFWVSSCLLIFPESGVLWCSQVLELSLLSLAFSLILTVASRLLHPYSTDDKTPRLMMKQFSTVRDMQRGSQSIWRQEERGGR